MATPTRLGSGSGIARRCVAAMCSLFVAASFAGAQATPPMPVLSAVGRGIADSVARCYIQDCLGTGDRYAYIQNYSATPVASGLYSDASTGEHYLCLLGHRRHASDRQLAAAGSLVTVNLYSRDVAQSDAIGIYPRSCYRGFHVAFLDASKTLSADGYFPLPGFDKKGPLQVAFAGRWETDSTGVKATDLVVKLDLPGLPNDFWEVFAKEAKADLGWEADVDWGSEALVDGVADLLMALQGEKAVSNFRTQLPVDDGEEVGFEKFGESLLFSNVKLQWDAKRSLYYAFLPVGMLAVGGEGIGKESWDHLFLTYAPVVEGMEGRSTAKWKMTLEYGEMKRLHLDYDGRRLGIYIDHDGLRDRLAKLPAQRGIYLLQEKDVDEHVSRTINRYIFMTEEG